LRGGHQEALILRDNNKKISSCEPAGGICHGSSFRPTVRSSPTVSFSRGICSSELVNTFLVVKHGRHHAHLITTVVAPADMLLHIFALKS
jgi:hypothetical protein